ncbi:type IV pilus assembly protein PilM [Gryllotalpicola daejeonensis]|uniref:Type IV pilus assembly protein PilM n=1 Tax=Gryllotalpicola daejeonensis TaxID=993087 RepID=A0ABP7ZJM1_9MICO
MPTSVVGVDIGSTMLRAVEVEDPAKPRPTVVRVHEVPLPEGAANRGEVLEPNTVAQSLKLLWAGAKFKSKDVVLGVGNQRVLARDFQVPKMSLARIRESLPFEAQDLLPVPVADALLDFYPVAEVPGEQGPMVNGLLIAAVKEVVLGNVKATDLAGLRAVDVDVIPFALSRVLISRQESRGTVALIDIGANTTNVVVAKEGAPQFVRIIPTGGAELTRQLTLGLEVDQPRAEQVKRQLGLARQVSTDEEHRAVQVVYQVTNELLLSLRNTINYYVNTRAGEVVNQIVLTGGGSQLPGFAQALAEFTRIPVSVGDPFAAVKVAKTVPVQTLEERRTTHAVALGLALGSAA